MPRQGYGATTGATIQQIDLPVHRGVPIALRPGLSNGANRE
jgi:hypothetical protein